MESEYTAQPTAAPSLTPATQAPAPAAAPALAEAIYRDVASDYARMAVRQLAGGVKIDGAKVDADLSTIAALALAAGDVWQSALDGPADQDEG